MPPSKRASHPFKVLVTDFYDEWLSSGLCKFTEAGNRKPPPRGKMVEWVLMSWAALPKDLIRKSFKVCALNLVVDVIEDTLIHCFKEGSPCAAGAELLRQQLMVQGNLFLMKNPFENTDEDMEEFLLLDLSDDEDFVDILAA